jgi:hypothetical protein
LTLLQVVELSTASDFHFSATACVCATRLRRLGKPFIHFFLVGEQLFNARALLHALEMRGGNRGLVFYFQTFQLIGSFIPRWRFEFNSTTVWLQLESPPRRIPGLVLQ